jgi:3-oxoadipate enol-lactonase
MLKPQSMPINCLFHSPCIDLNYYDQGSGEALILIHGLGGKGDRWRFQIEALSKDYRVIALDLRGHGQSGYRLEEPITIKAFADDVITLMTGLGLDQAHFCGLSMGGVISLEIFVRYSLRVKSLILADTMAFFPSPQRLEEFLRLFDSMGMAEWGQLVALLTLCREAPDELRQEVAAMIAANRRAPYRQALIATFSSDYRWLLPLIDVPTLILVGEDDQATPIGYARYLQAHIKDSVLQVIPRAAHISNLENPAEFNRQLVAHLGKCQQK